MVGKTGLHGETLGEDMNRVLFSKKSIHWATPSDVYKDLDKEFSFTLDGCPLGEYLGNFISWSGERVYVNPPYGTEIREWLCRAKEADVAVYLLPARTDTRWFHDEILKNAKEIRFIRGRLKFGGATFNAPFPSMVVIYKKGEDMTFPQISKEGVRRA